ncbi:MTH938/NDUFAF3 family protein [Candidatus Legionella polyplacis]|uniref:MTH938/NDUFAF3 family protein n=1 Tax=Candidatus Legionella polyplacis TaxID=2005262 RepID=A0ABZ2GXD7_9GAMM
MHINLEYCQKHSIQSYGSNFIKINSVIYKKSLIVNNNTIISNWKVKSIYDINKNNIKPLILHKANIILIGSNNIQISYLNKLKKFFTKKTAIECMSISSACKVFNILLCENRYVSIGIIL